MAGSDKGLKVFVSYARGDGSAFAEQLIDGLEIGGFEPFLDRHDIAAGEDWETRLEGLIAAADTLVYVISPASIASERCGWEIERARTLSKRVLPVVLLDVPDEKIPPSLARLNFIYFNRGNTFPRALKELVAALKTDEGWIREHTRLAEEAARWVTHGRDASLLLRGPELAAAQRWLEVARPEAPPPTDLHRELIRESAAFAQNELESERQRLAVLASQQADKEQALKQLSRRTRFGLAAATVLVLVAGGLAVWAYNAEARFREEQQRAEVAFEVETQRMIAEEVARTDLAGQFIAYATGPGSMAYDGEGNLSPFSTAMLKNLEPRDTSLFEGVIAAQAEVLAATDGAQRPFVSTDLNGDIYLGRASRTRKLTALVVGMSQYEFAEPLANTVNDARAWEQFFQAAGFDVTALFDLSHDRLLNALGMTEAVTPAGGVPGAGPPRIVNAAIGDMPVIAGPEPDSLVVFVYSGHGVMIDGENYLAPVDADASTLEGLKAKAVGLTQISNHLRDTGAASVMILDTQFSDIFRGR